MKLAGLIEVTGVLVLQYVFIVVYIKKKFVAMGAYAVSIEKKLIVPILVACLFAFTINLV